MIVVSNAPVRENQNEKFEQMLPLIKKQASIAFRGEPQERREDLIAEVIANAFVAYTRLVERGKAEVIYATPLAQYAIMQVRVGRRVGGNLNIKDVCSEYAQRSKGFTVQNLDRYNQRREEWKEVVVEDRHAGPADIAACRIDFAAWLTTLNDMQRRAAGLLAVGETTTTTAKEMGVTAGRISQMRRELKVAWELFHGMIGGSDFAASCGRA